MARQKKFSNFLVALLVTFVFLSLSLVVGVLYSILSASMTRQFNHEIEMQAAEINTAIDDRIGFLETQLRVLSLNNAVRVSLMLGVHGQLKEIMANQYAPVNGMMFAVEDQAGGAFTPELPTPLQGLSAEVEPFRKGEKIWPARFFRTVQGRFVFLASVPLERKNARLGTAYALYDMAMDKDFWQRFQRQYAGRLCLRDGPDLVDLQTGRRVDFQPEGPADRRLIPMGKVTGLVYAADIRPLGREKAYLVFLMAVLCGAIFCLTLLLSIVLARKISTPLEIMADQALAVAREPSGALLDVDAIQYVEFGKLARAFNRVLKSLLHTQKALVRHRDTLAEQVRDQTVALVRSETALATILDSLPYGVMIVGRDRRVRGANQAALKMMGYETLDQVKNTVCHCNICPAEEGACPILDLGEKIDLAERLLINREGETVPILKSVLFPWCSKTKRCFLRPSWISPKGRGHTRNCMRQTWH